VERVRIKKGDMYTVTKESRATPQPVHHTDHRLVKKKEKEKKLKGFLTLPIPQEHKIHFFKILYK